MKRLIVVFSFLTISLAPSLASAFPNMIYNPSNGNIQFVNDTPNPLFAMYILSPTNRITGTALMIPGATRDNTEQPWALSYLSVPPGVHNVGNVIQPGTLASDLSAFFYYTPGNGPFPIGTPEPATALLAALAGTPLVQLARRRSRRLIASIRSGLEQIEVLQRS